MSNKHFEIEIKNTEIKYNQFFLDIYQRGFLKIILIGLPISLFIAINFSQFNDELLEALVITVFGVLIILFFFHFLPKYKEIQDLKTFIKSNGSITTIKTITITSDALTITELDKSKIYNWREVLYYTITSNFIQIILIDKTHLLIPKKAFRLNSDLNYLQEILGEELTNNQKILKNPFPHEKPPYYLGILGVIPLIGGLLGIVLFFLGIFVYKDNILTFLGVASIFFTIYLYWEILKTAF